MKIFLILFLVVFTTNHVISQVDEEVYSVVEDMPIFLEKCDLENTYKSNECNMKEVFNYRNEISQTKKNTKGTKGRAYVSFIVEKDGSVSSVKLLRGFNKKLDKIALKHIEKMPKWYKPGFQRGKAVRVKYNIPIDFK